MKWKALFITSAAVIALAGCRPGGSQPDTQETTNTPPPTGAMQQQPENATVMPPNADTALAADSSTANSGAMEGKDGYIASCGQKLKDMEGKINELADKAAANTGEIKTQADLAVASLRQKADSAKVQLEHLKGASAEAWGDIKAGFESALADLKKAYEDAKSRLG